MFCEFVFVSCAKSLISQCSGAHSALAVGAGAIDAVLAAMRAHVNNAPFVLKDACAALWSLCVGGKRVLDSVLLFSCV
jgi:hypothetical protein